MCKTAYTYYRELHRIPEKSEQEYETAQYLVRALQDMGYTPVRIGKTGVYADLVCDENLPWILLRSDMDALTISEASAVDFHSEHPGMMHACGHDSHMAMLLETAGKLRGEKLPQNIRFLFQPAEETTTGATQMLAENVMPESCCGAFAIHVWPGVPYGTLATKVGSMMASSDVYRISCHGKIAHCARRETGADALQTAVQIAASLPEIESLAENDGTVLFCGSIHSGSSHNIVPDEASLLGTLRTYSEEKRTKIIQVLEQTVHRWAEHYATQAEVQWEGGCPAVSNDEHLVAKLEKLFETLDVHVAPVLAAEDFSLYQRQCPGVMIWLGLGQWPLLHTNEFYVPDDILFKGVSSWCKIGRHVWK